MDSEATQAIEPQSAAEQMAKELASTIHYVLQRGMTMLTTGPEKSTTTAAEGRSGLALRVEVPPISPLAAEAITLARSKDVRDHDRLAEMLINTAYLNRLDAPELVQVAEPDALQLSHVLRVAAADAPGVVDRLTESQLYSGPGPLQIALISASAGVAAPDEVLVRFWRFQLDPEADELGSTIDALLANQSAVAIELLVQAFTDEGFDNEIVFWWFRGPLLERRQDPPLLAMAENLVAGAGDARLSDERRFVLVEALFDYRPSDWYVATEAPPTPPDRAALTEQARRRLLAIADIAERDGLIDAARRAQIETQLSPEQP